MTTANPSDNLPDWLRMLPCATALIDASAPAFPLLCANSAFGRLTGYPDRGVQGVGFDNLAADPVEPGWAVLREALAQGGAGQAEVGCRRRDGSCFFAEISVAPAGESRYVAVCADVTARREALGALSAERDRLLAFIEHVPLGMLALDWIVSGVFIADAARPGLPIIYVNAAFERLTGYQGEEAVGSGVDFLLEEAAGTDSLTAIRSALRDGRETKAELHSRRKDGSRFWNELTLSPVFDEAGRLTHYLGIQTDIGERKESERRLQELSDALRKSRDDVVAILNEFPSGTMIVEADGTVSFASASCLSILGLGAESAVGKHWRQVFPLANGEAADSLRLALESRASARGHLTLRWQGDGLATRWAECAVKDDPRSPERRLVFLDDVTELHRLKAKLEDKRHGGLVGDSEAMAELNRLIENTARGDWTVLIEGETGVGKELVARGIHECSPRRGGPFVAVNSAGLSESLLASQLFGHRKGAFTGATADQPGFFEAASGGTLFLDEIGDLPFPMQAALLRVLQERKIMRLGETKERDIDVRVLAATHKNLVAEAAAGRFREDLLFRLRVARINIPPLRSRKTDIPLLAGHFLLAAGRQVGQSAETLDADALRCLLAYDWPGNVRELRSCLEYALIHCRGDRVRVDDLPPEVRAACAAGGGGVDAAVPESGGDVRGRVLQALEKAGGNRSQAAKLLGISRATLYRRLQALGLEPEA